MYCKPTKQLIVKYIYHEWFNPIPYHSQWLLLLINHLQHKHGVINISIISMHEVMR